LKNSEVAVLNEKGERQEVEKIIGDIKSHLIDEEPSGVVSEWKNFYDEITRKEGRTFGVPVDKGFHHLAVVIAALSSTLTRTIEKVESV
jgi:hypothetical protein